MFQMALAEPYPPTPAPRNMSCRLEFCSPPSPNPKTKAPTTSSCGSAAIASRPVAATASDGMTMRRGSYRSPMRPATQRDPVAAAPKAKSPIAASHGPNAPPAVIGSQVMSTPAANVAHRKAMESLRMAGRRMVCSIPCTSSGRGNCMGTSTVPTPSSATLPAAMNSTSKPTRSTSQTPKGRARIDGMPTTTP